MKLLTSSSLRALAIAAACCGRFASASTVTFVNRCDRQINLYDNAQEVPMAPGAALARDVSDGFKGMFRAGKNPQATLAEFTHAGGKLWYDISIIPTSPTQGPEYCPSLAACKQLTGGTGYNEPMQIAPQSNINGAHCRVLTCLSDGCDDAYQFPKDDTKTHNCPGATDFVVTFCPGGSGGTRAVPAPAPVATTTAPPVPTTAPPLATTAAPTTQPPTPVPTTAAPTTPVGVSVANSSVEIEQDADQLVAGSAASHATGASIDVIVNPELATQTQVPVFDTTASVQTPEPPQAPVASNANTQSSTTTGGSTLTTVFVAAVLVLAAAVAIVAIVVVRRKKRELDAQTEKSPIMNPGLATL